MEVHPKIPAAQSRPDFRARHGGTSFYLEGTVIDPKDGLCSSNPLEEDALAKINELESSKFYILARVDGKLSRALKREKIVKPFAELLEAQDPDEVQRMIDIGGPYMAPSRKVKFGTWEIHGRLIPIPPDKRSDGKSRSLIIGPARGGMVDCSTPIRRAVHKKARKYGRLDGPLVVAANVRRDVFLARDSELEALFGKEQVTFYKDRPDLIPKLHHKPDGIWIQGDRACGWRPRYTRLTGVWIFRDVAPWNLHTAGNCLYVNPFGGEIKFPDILHRLSIRECA